MAKLISMAANGFTRGFKRLSICFLALTLIIAQTNISHAQANNLPIVRDAEIEALLVDYITPILKVAGVKPRRTQVVLINSKEFNAFVSGSKIFVNLGTIVETQTPNELIGVLAHEIGHLAGGHLNRLHEQLDRAQTIAVVAALLGVGAVIAAGSQGSSAGAGAGAGLAIGGIEASRRSILSYQRTEEAAADRSAITYLNKTKQSTKGLLRTFEGLQKSISLIESRINPYLQSHPLPRERIAALQTLAKESPYYDKKDSAALQFRHDKARAKILAYTYGPNAVDRFFPATTNKNAIEYGRTISTFLYHNPRAAVPMIDRLIKSEPKNPYFWEIKGEVLLKAQDANGAATAFSKATQLDNGRSATILVALGQALVLSGTEPNLRRAIGELEVAVALDENSPRAYQQLAMAYGRLGDTASANLATAEENFYQGQFKMARQFAARAQRAFPKDAPQWLRADDIIRFKAPKR